MKSLIKVALGLGLLAGVIVPAHASFSSLYVFGDALSATSDSDPDTGSPGSPLYDGYRWSNGRVWVEVLAQRQGISFSDAKNSSHFNHNSAELAAELLAFNPPSDVANDLFVVWVCNADTFDATSDVLNNPSKNHSILLNQFVAENILAQTSNLQIILNLYNKGVRTLVLPNAVDISKIPAFNAGDVTDVLHAGCVDYNSRFAATIAQAKSVCPGLTIYTLDFYTLLNNVMANPGFYGLKNALYNGLSIDALDDPALSNYALNGPGAAYIFWDEKDPTAKFHEIIADVAQQIISPVGINQLVVGNGSNRLDVVNVPLGLSGFVEGTTNLALGGWTVVTNFNSTSLSQSLFVNAAPLPPATPASGTGGSGSIDPNNPGQGGTYIAPNNPAQYYRLHFPYAWSWP